jgi:hypothetical protein
MDTSDTLQTMAYQINANAPVTFSTYNTSAGTWYADLTTADCSSTNTYYLLTVYAYYPGGGIWAQRSFERGD